MLVSPLVLQQGYRSAPVVEWRCFYHSHSPRPGPGSDQAPLTRSTPGEPSHSDGSGMQSGSLGTQCPRQSPSGKDNIFLPDYCPRKNTMLYHCFYVYIGIRHIISHSLASPPPHCKCQSLVSSPTSQEFFLQLLSLWQSQEQKMLILLCSWQQI